MPLNPAQIQYDALGRRTVLTLPNQVSTEYQFDAASRLTGLIYRNAVRTLGDISYRYDPAGNRTAIGGSFARTLFPDAIPSAAYDAASRQLSFGGKTMTFDANGNLTGLTEGTLTTVFTWNARDWLVGMAGSGITVSHSYDSLGRRAIKATSIEERTYQHDGLDLARKLVGGTEAIFLRGPAIDDPLVRISDAAPEHYLLDALGSVVALTDRDGELQTRYTYAPFGQAATEGIASANRVGFTAREDDGAGLYYYRARFYHPGLHRFLSEDPTTLEGGASRYTYAANNPIVFVDPLGLDKKKRDDECPGGVWRGRGVAAGGVIGHLGYWSTTAFPPGLFCVGNPSVTVPYVQRSVFVGVGAGGGASYELIQVVNAPRRQDLYTTSPDQVQTSFTAFGGVGAFTGVGPGVSVSVGSSGFQTGFGGGAGAGAGVSFSKTSPY